MATSAALVLLGFVLSLCLELPDEEADKVCGKMNLVARFGAVACTRLALLLCLGSTTMLLLFSGTALCSASLVPLATVALGNLMMFRRCQPDTISTVCIQSLYVFLIISVVLLVIQL
jgi:1,4-dihydroxy-2-naphthoate octaprenyltransferase